MFGAKQRMRLFYLTVISLLLTSMPVVAQFDAAPSFDVMGAGAADEFLPVEQAYRLNPRLEQGQLTLDWTIASGYYLYKQRFDAKMLVDGKSVPLNIELPEGLPKDDEYFGKVVVYYAELIAQAGRLAADQDVEITIRSQGCADAGLCYPPHDQRFLFDAANAAFVPLEAPIPGEQPEPVISDGEQNVALFGDVVSSVWQAAFYAFLGGLILNLMPCVFPVLALKVISVVEAHGVGARERRLQGLAYTAGIVLSFVAVAAVLLALRASGQALGWGFQLQSPWLVGLLAYLFFVMGLALSGALELGASWAGAGQKLTESKGYTGTFFTGVLAVIVASPCTAPFMGAALGFALVQAPVSALFIFVALGLGMAAPFALMTAFPALTQYLPKPGAWMVSLKEFLAFPMYLSAVALLWLLGRQAGIDAIGLILAGIVLIGLAIWLWSGSGWKRLISVLLLISALSFLWAEQLTPQAKTNDKPGQVFSAERVQALRAQGRPVFVNFTADWCVTCIANERVALSSPEFLTVMESHNVAYLVADWTNSDPVISKVLNEYGRSGVPLYLLFPAKQGQAVMVLPQLLTTGLLVDAVQALPVQR